jgi:hypothetical protein
VFCFAIMWYSVLVIANLLIPQSSWCVCWAYSAEKIEIEAAHRHSSPQDSYDTRNNQKVTIDTPKSHLTN